MWIVVGPTKVVFVFLSQRFFLCPGSKRLYTTWVFFSRSLSKRALFPAARGFFLTRVFFDPGQGVVNFLGGRTYVYDEIKGQNQSRICLRSSDSWMCFRCCSKSYLSFFLRFLSLSREQRGFFFSEGA